MFLRSAAEEAAETALFWRGRDGHRHRRWRRCGHVSNLVDDVRVFPDLDRKRELQFAMFDPRKSFSRVSARCMV